MKSYRKTFIGSIFAFLAGISCCWMSSLAIWLGGASILGILVEHIEYFQVQLIILSIILAIISLYLYQKKKREKPD